MSKKRGRKPHNRVQEHMPQQKVNGAKEHMDEKDEKDEKETGTRRVPAERADYLAALLHEANANLIETRAKSFHKDKLLLGKDDEILRLRDENLKLRKEMHNLRIKIASDQEKKLQAENEKLRASHNLDLGGSIHMDDETGEVYRVVPAESDPQE